MKYNESIIIREYLPTDKDAIMSLIKLNTPDFFAEEEANDLSKYLDEEIEQYYVLLVLPFFGGFGKHAQFLVV